MQRAPTLAVLSVLLLVQPAPAQEKKEPVRPPAAAATLDELLGKFAKAPGLYARFREEKHMALLAAPLVNEGTLHFVPPGRVARHVTKPAAQTVLIEKTAVRMGDADHVETLSLKGNPVLRQFLDSFMKVFSGDKAGLQKSYELFFTAGKEAWTLELKPKRSPMKDAIRSITFVGKDLVMRSLTITEVGGDKSVTTFSDVDPQRSYSAKEVEAIFRMPGKKKGER